MFFLLLVEVLRKLYRSPRRDLVKAIRFLPFWTAALLVTLILQCPSVVMKTTTPLGSLEPDYMTAGQRQMIEKRAAIQRQLQSEPDRHLVVALSPWTSL